ncbi:MAG: MOSC domain-containing protein [Ilumatobacter sp.]|uniref:MOSC domain-containing protein n=1 Tax=Ilumatobacter sp. TaxID=1967498 RepID=UPI003299C3F6
MSFDPSGSRVVAVHRARDHEFSKTTVESIMLLAGLGVEGDAHMGARVKHRSRVAKDPLQPNLRQVHLIASELLDEVNAKGYGVAPGDLGENITTVGLDLISLPVGTSIRIGDAILTLTGLRNPCVQIGAFAEGLQGEMLGRDADGKLLRKTGVMAVVIHGGVVAAGDSVLVAPPAGEPQAMNAI